MTRRAIASLPTSTPARPVAALVAVALAAWLAGCTTLGPDFHAPDTGVPATFRHAAPAPTPTPATPATAPVAPAAVAAPDRWWTLFGDATLDALQDRALGASPTLAAAEARSARARALLAVAGADASPRVTADGSAQRFGGSRTVATAPVVAGRRVGVTADQWQVQASLGWELDLWGRVKRSTEVAQAQLDAATLDARAARLALTADVASAWVTLRALDDEARIVVAARDARRDALRVVQSRFDAGTTQEGDLQRARTDLANAQADVAELARRRELAEHALAVLCGWAPADGAAVSATAAVGRPGAVAPAAAAAGRTAWPVPPTVPAGLPAQVLQRRPDIGQAEAALQAATAQIGVAEAAFYPSIRLTGSAGFASQDLGDLLKSPSRLFGIGPSISLPVLDGGRTRATLAAAQAARDESLATFRQRVLLALREVDDALGDLQQRDRIAVAQREAAEAADRAVRVARLRYAEGASSYLEVTDADRTALAAERALSQTRAAQWQSTVQLVRALGGGWGG